MCESNKSPHLPRRKFLTAAGVAAISIQALSTEVYAAQVGHSAIPKPQNLLGPAAALARLKEGNSRYVDGLSGQHDFLHEREALAGAQNPYAAVLSCSDSRIAPEYAFDSGRGDIFAVRVAGNFANDDGIGSLEYAVAVLRTPLIVVLGHESCGAVDAAVKLQKDGATYPGKIQGIATAIAPAVRQVLGSDGNLLDNAIRRNVIDNVAKLNAGSAILSDAVGKNKLMIVGALYQLATGRVVFI